MNKYTCPMHPQVLKDEPGKCPLCGMTLVPVGSTSASHKHTSGHGHAEHSSHDHEKEGFNKHAGHHTGDFLKRFWVSLVITVPILLLSHMIQQWLGFSLAFTGDKYVLLALGTAIYLYGGLPFLKGMMGEMKAKAIGMMTLVAIAISVAYIYSVAVVFGLQGMDFFWELATLIDIMLLGHWLEMRSQMAASRALQSLVALLPNDVTVERNGEAVKIKLEELQSNETVIIKPGEKIPADGLVLEGVSYINESMLTGESVPVKKETNSKVASRSPSGLNRASHNWLA